MIEMKFEIETEVEVDGRWIAEIPSIPGVMAYGATKAESLQRVQALALRVIADQLENDESEAFLNLRFLAA